MITFTDMCKSCVRYWYVTVSCIVLALFCVLVILPSSNSYVATNTLAVESVTPGEQVSINDAESSIKEMTALIDRTNFIKNIIETIRLDDKEFAETLTIGNIKENLKINYPKNARFFEISYNNSDKARSLKLIDVATTLAIEAYNQGESHKFVKFTKNYTTDVSVIESKLPLFSVIAILAGGVLGIIVVTCFVMFNPYVENKDLLSKELELPVLASLEKKKEAKNEK